MNKKDDISQAMSLLSHYKEPAPQTKEVRRVKRRILSKSPRSLMAHYLKQFFSAYSN